MGVQQYGAVPSDMGNLLTQHLRVQNDLVSRELGPSILDTPTRIYMSSKSCVGSNPGEIFRAESDNVKAPLVSEKT